MRIVYFTENKQKSSPILHLLRPKNVEVRRAADYKTVLNDTGQTIVLFHIDEDNYVEYYRVLLDVAARDACKSMVIAEQTVMDWDIEALQNVASFVMVRPLDIDKLLDEVRFTAEPNKMLPSNDNRSENFEMFSSMKSLVSKISYSTLNSYSVDAEIEKIRKSVVGDLSALQEIEVNASIELRHLFISKGWMDVKYISESSSKCIRVKDYASLYVALKAMSDYIEHDLDTTPLRVTERMSDGKLVLEIRLGYDVKKRVLQKNERLAFCRDMLDKLDGTICSTTDGLGSCVKISIPML